MRWIENYLCSPTQRERHDGLELKKTQYQRDGASQELQERVVVSCLKLIQFKQLLRFPSSSVYFLIELLM